MGRTLTWHLAWASVRGTAHEQDGSDCQDSCNAGVFRNSSGEWVLAAIAADGAGSAKAGGNAAEAVCTYGLHLVETFVQNDALTSEHLTEQRMFEWARDMRQHLLTLAEHAGQTPRDWACTLLAAVCTRSVAAYLQVGDGAIVARCGGADAVVYWPSSGEYANETFFLTDEDGLQRLQVSVTETVPSALALLTDGLQRLALNYSARTAHSAFFSPLFGELQCAASIDPGEFEGRLQRLLASPQVNARTDDDKTLVLAAKTE